MEREALGCASPASHVRTPRSAPTRTQSVRSTRFKTTRPGARTSPAHSPVRPSPTRRGAAGAATSKSFRSSRRRIFTHTCAKRQSTLRAISSCTLYRPPTPATLARRPATQGATAMTTASSEKVSPLGKLPDRSVTRLNGNLSLAYTPPAARLHQTVPASVRELSTFQ